MTLKTRFRITYGIEYELRRARTEYKDGGRMPDIVLRKAVENADNTAKGREPVQLPSPNANKAAQTFPKCRQSGGAGFFRIRRGDTGSFSAVLRELFPRTRRGEAVSAHTRG